MIEISSLLFFFVCFFNILVTIAITTSQLMLQHSFIYLFIIKQ